MMNKNDLFELTITDIGVEGEGIGRYDGMTFFVKDACIGDVIRARVTKLKKNYGYARVEEVITPSTFRVIPKCPIYRQCGGCQIQMLSYDKQLEFKANKVRGNLLRLGHFPEEEVDRVMLPIVGMEDPFRYRNKAQFPAGYDREGNLTFGFYASRSHNIIPAEECYLGVEENSRILALVKAWMLEEGLKAYDEEKGTGLLRHVLIRKGFRTGELMVCLVINSKKLQKSESLCDKLSVLPGMKSISYNVNTANTNKILGDETVCVWGTPYITDYIRDFAFHISPQSFYQVNPVQTEKLYGLALDFAGLTGQENVWDLYCGIGTISLFLSQKAGKVYGVEIVPQAIADARENAKRNHADNATFFVGEAETILPAFAKGDRETILQAGDNQVALDAIKDDTDMKRPDVIVVDPPRKGCDEVCLSTMLAMAPSKIVYVSCDSATLARDLQILCEGGYELVKVQPVDQFPHTVHVETVALLHKGQ